MYDTCSQRFSTKTQTLDLSNIYKTKFKIVYNDIRKSFQIKSPVYLNNIASLYLLDRMRTGKISIYDIFNPLISIILSLWKSQQTRYCIKGLHKICVGSTLSSTIFSLKYLTDEMIFSSHAQTNINDNKCHL